MKLANAAKTFHKLSCTDAYNSVSGVTFLAHVTAADDTLRDSVTVARRVISVAPGTALPARNTVAFDNSIWMVGVPTVDYYNGVPIRSKHVAHQADQLATIKTFAEILAAAAGTPTYCSRIWVKREKEIDISSDVVNEFNLYFAPGEPIAIGSLVFLNTRWHLLRTTYPGETGFVIAIADELPEPLQVTATFAKRVYVPLTDSYTTTPTAIAALRLRWQSHFRYPMTGVEKFKPGDAVLVVLKSAITPAAGDAVTINGDTFVIEAVIDEAPCWALHLCNV